MSSRRVIVAGGGAAGFFAAIQCAEAAPDTEVTLLEKGAHFLAKVRISGGGRCNVTHACFDPRELSAAYPRGAQALIGAFHRFQVRDTIDWFEARGVALKREADGRMFPITDTSETVIECLLTAARRAGVNLLLNRGVETVSHRSGGGFDLRLTGGETMTCDRLLLATGGCRAAVMGQLAVGLGHTLEAPVPSLFTFQVQSPWIRQLPGVSLEQVEVSIPGTKLRECGPLLITHTGLSGPVILRLSAWGARTLADRDYQFTACLNWLSQRKAGQVAAELEARRRSHPARLVTNVPIPPLTARMWEKLTLAADVGRETRWAELSAQARHRLEMQLLRTELTVTGKSLNKDEFVTCGGVRLSEVNFKTMESRICPGLFFAGELLDVDGITGGFNFQAAWTTGWIAGQALAGE